MAEIRTRDEALDAVDKGLARWETHVSGLLVQSAGVITSWNSFADGEVRRWKSRSAALQATLNSIGPNDDPRPVRNELMRAERNLQSVRLVSAQIQEIARQISSLQRTQAILNSELINSARADLSRRTSALGSYRGSNRSGDVPTGSSSRTENEAIIPNKMGLSSIELELTDFDDNPIIGDFGRGGATRSDYRWAVQIWSDEVEPGVARGMTRSDFEVQDVARGASPLRSRAVVYDLFLGDSDRIRVSRRPNGTFNVTNGRHRIEVARELGIRSLAGEVFG